MRRRSVLGGMIVAAGVSGTSVATPAPRRSTAPQTPVLDTLAMPVTPEQNRQYSYTDKVSGYFHGRTHMDDNPDWFNGWNIATKRIFRDYALSVDGVPLSRTQANVVVSPHKLVRRFESATETLSLLDGMAVLVLGIGEVRGETISLALRGDLTDVGTLASEGVWYAPKEAAGSHLLVTPINAQTVQLEPVQGIVAPKAAAGFYMIYAATKPEARALLSRVRRGATAMLVARAARMEALVSGNNALDAGDPDRTKALLWMRLTTDQLVMKQMGTGIYAGLPWFNDYWGRDTFISITGALFVSGQYEIAADVFRSFAALQDVDPASKTYGRVPNRARPDGIEYNSADGTPRFIITLADLVNRSGNVALARELWPAVKRAVEGVLKNNVDELGLITHDDADTWMDAKEKGVRAWSPRGNRAIDVQALWVEAFGAAVELADRGVDSLRTRLDFQGKCNAAQDRLWSATKEQFVDPVTLSVVDHLKPDGTRDTKLRPNAFFAYAKHDPDWGYVVGTLEMVQRRMRWARQLWEGLVYPWGVATLSQDDPDFHPYHEHWHYYHKDASYHNGTVWPWLNGVAMESLLEFGVVEQPWQLFENMNRQALREGAVGSLAECADALPVQGATWTRQTGTFLQAWSNAEHLRVWQEGFLGLYAGKDWVNVMPALPSTVTNVTMTMRVGNGHLVGKWHDGGPNRWSFELKGQNAQFTFCLLEFESSLLLWDLKAGQRVTIVREGDTLLLTAFDQKGRRIGEERQESDEKFQRDKNARVAALATPLVGWTPDTQWVDFEKARNEIFAGIDFCKPRLNPNLKSLSVRHDPPLTY